MSLKSLSGLKIGDYTLPTSDGTNGQVLQTDGSGNVTFQSVSISDKFTSGLSFDTSTGVLTATVTNGSNVTVDLNGRYVPLGGGSGSGNAMTGDLHIITGGPKIYLQDNTDDDDQQIVFRNNGGSNEYIIGTSDFTSGGGGDGFYIGSTTSDGEIGLVTANTTALTLDTSQNASFAGEVKVQTYFRGATALRFRKSTNTWDAMAMTENGKLELASGGSNDRGQIYLHADHGSTPRAGLVAFENENQGTSFLFTDTNKRLKFHTADPGEDDSLGEKVFYNNFPDTATFGGDIAGDKITLTQGAYSDGYRLVRSGHDTYRIALGDSEGLQIINETDSSRKELRFNGAGNATFAGSTTSTKVNINQAADEQGLEIKGYDDHSSSDIKLQVNASGHARLSQTTDGGSGYLFLEAENYLNLQAGTLIYTQNQLRIYDSGSISFGSGGDFHLSYNSTADELRLMEASTGTKGLKMDTDGKVTFTEDTTFAAAVTVEGGTLELGKADTSSGHINAKELMTFNIDTDNDDTNRYFAWYKDSSSGSGTELLKILETGATTFAGKINAKGGSSITGFHAATINAYSATVSSNLYSALRIIDNTAASSYWDVGATGNASTLLNFYHNGSTSPKVSFTHTGNATFAGSVTGTSLVAPNVYAQNLYITSSGTSAVNRIDNDTSSLYITYGGISNRALEISNSNGNATFVNDIETPGTINLPGNGNTATREILINAHGTRAKLMKEGNAAYWQVAQGSNQFEITDAANGNSTKGNVLLRTNGHDDYDNKLILVPNGGTVGINTPVPFTANASADELVVGSGSGNQGMTIYSGDSNSGSIYFADDLDEEGAGDSPAGNRDGVIQYSHSNSEFNFKTGGNQQALELKHTGATFVSNILAGNNVYAAGNEGFVFGSSTSEGEYIKRSGNDILFYSGGSEKVRITSNQLILQGSSSTEGAEIKMAISTSGQTFHLDNNSGNFRIHTLASGKYMQIVGADGTNTKLYGDKIEAYNVFVSNDLYVPNEIYHTGDTNTFIQFPGADQFRINTGGGNRLQVQNDKILVGDDVNMQYDSISTGNSGTVVYGGFLNPASEANMVHIPHIINDLAGFNKWSNATITTSGFYQTRSGSAGSYTYSNEVSSSTAGWANAFDAHSSTAGSWYSDNGSDGVYTHGTDTPGVVELQWTNEATYSLWAGIVFGSGSFTATYVKIEAYRGGAWQTLCEITNNTDQVILRQVANNSGTGAATTRLKYTLGGSVNNSYFRIHSLYMANYRAGDNNLNNTSIDSTRGVNFLERYKNNYAHGHFYPGANNTYDIGSSSYKWNNVNAVTLNGNLVGTIHSNTTANTQSQGNNSTKVATTAYVDTAVTNLVDSAPGTLNTLNELAAALGDDANFSTTVTNNIAGKVSKSGDTMTGGLTIGSDASGHDFLVYGNATGEKMLWDTSESRLVINHDTDDFGVGIFTVGSAQMTQPQLKVGRDQNQYWGVYTDDRNAHLVHRQDETSGIMTTRFDQWDSNTSDNTGQWQWRSGNGTGGSMTTAAVLYQDGDFTVGGDLMPISDGGGSLGGGSGINLRWSGLELQSGAGIQWQNGDARIVEGLVNNYSLSLQTYDGSALSTALRLDGDNNANFAGRVGIGTDPASGMKLHVNGEVRVDATEGVATRKIRAGYFSSTTDIRVEAGSAGDVILGDSSAARLTLASDDSATFAGGLTIGGVLDGVTNMFLGEYLYHQGDGDTYLNFQNANEFRIVVGGSEKLHFNTARARINQHLYVAADSSYDLGQNATRFRTLYVDDIDGGNSKLLTSDASNYFRINTSGGSAQLGLFRTTSGTIGGGYIGIDVNKFRIYNDSFSEKFSVGISTGDVNTKGHIILPSGKYLEFSGQGKLVNMDVTSWSNASEHNLLYSGWESSIGDYLSFKVPGNSTTNHGNLIIGDNGLWFGRMNATDSAQATDSNTNPHSGSGSNYFRVNTAGDMQVSGSVISPIYYDTSGTTYYLDLGNTSTSLNVPGSINLLDNKMLLWGGNSIIKHTGSATQIGDNSSGSVLTIASGDADFTGNVEMQSGNSVGKFAVMSTAPHGSYDFYNNGTSYFNGAVTIDDNLSFTGDDRILSLAGGTTNSQSRVIIGEQGVYGVSFRWNSGSDLEFDGFWNSSVTGSRNRDLGSVDVNNRRWNFENTVVVGGSVTAGSFVKSGGTSSQFLMADGSVSTGGGTIDGSGVANRLAIWSDSDTLTSNVNIAVSSGQLNLGNGLLVEDNDTTVITAKAYEPHIVWQKTRGSSGDDFFKIKAENDAMVVDFTTARDGGSDTRVLRIDNNNNFVFSTNGSYTQLHSSFMSIYGRVTSTADIRSTQYYDYNDTTKYIDLNSTGTSLVANGSGTFGGTITSTKSSTHTAQGSISAANAHLDLYNSLEANTDQKGSIITFTDNYYDGSNYNKTLRAAIKGGTDTTGNTADGYLEFYTDSGSANTPNLALRIDHDQKSTFSGDIIQGSDSGNTTTTLFGNSNNLVLRSQASGTRAPQIKFNIAGTDVSDLALHNNTSGIATNTLVYSVGGSAKVHFFSDGNVQTAGYITSTKFRDADNTAYYLDPASTSVLNAVSLGSFTMDGNTISGIDDSLEFTDNDSHIMTSAGIRDRFGFAYFQVISSSDDYDNYFTRGGYRFQGASNGPTTSHTTGFSIAEDSGGYGWQMVARGSADNSEQLYYRYKGAASDTPGNWQTIVTKTFADNRYLKLSGGQVSGNLTVTGTFNAGRTTIESASDNILTLNQTGTDTGWNYIDFKTAGDRKWFIGMDSNKNFDLYNDNINAYAITVDYATNAIALLDDVSITGNLTVNGTTTTVNQTNLDVSDNIIGLNRGASSNANDSGLIIERGSTGDNAAFLWDETADKFIFGTTTGTPASTGNVTFAPAPFGGKGLWTTTSAVTHWGPGVDGTAYGTLTWDTGYAAVHANGSNVLRLGSGSDTDAVIIDGSDMSIAGDLTVNGTDGIKVQRGGGTGNAIRLLTENDGSQIADSFSANTSKSYIYFDARSSSNDPGYIMHETSSTEANEGVLHLVPSDDNSTGDYVSIHGTNDPDVLKLHTSGLVETVNLQLQLKSGLNQIYLNDDILVAGASTFSSNVHIDGTSGSSGNAFSVDRGSDGAVAFRVQNSGEVVTSANYFYAAASGTSMYVQNTAVFRGGIINDSADAPVLINDSLKVNVDLEVAGGDITLGGTGRIQGVDTVSVSTDAANKDYVDNAVSGLATADTTYNFNMSTQLSANTWTDTGIDSSDMVTGTYIMQAEVSDYNLGGGHYTEYYSATMSFYGSGTNQTGASASDEIPVHRAGHAPNNGDIQFRTLRGASANLKLQVKHNLSYSAAPDQTTGKTFKFKFRKMI